jgi:hypothetical protein
VFADRQLDGASASRSFSGPETDTIPPQRSTSTTPTLFLAHAALALALFGCPSTSPTPAAIDRVEVVGDPKSDDFRLRIIGRGFGPTTISYDLSTGQGVATIDVRLEIYDSTEKIRIPIPTGDQLSVPSPGEIDARVVGNPLQPGIYGVRLYRSTGAQVIASRGPGAFTVSADGVPPDGDANQDIPDGGITPLDDAAADMTDGNGVSDSTIAPNSDAEEPMGDASEPPDLGPPDSGVLPDSGLGPFAGNFRYRRQVLAQNQTASPAPAGTTIAIEVPLQSLAGMMQAKMDGTDVALYLGPTQLDTQWESPKTLLASATARLIARLPVETPVGPIPESSPLILYWGDGQATVPRSDGVFTFVERFSAPVPAPPWRVNTWALCDRDYPLEATAPGTGGAYCVGDSASNPTKRTIATPVVSGMLANPGPNLTYEATFYVEGLMVDQTHDILYFAYGDAAQNVQTTILPTTYTLNPPLALLTFDDGSPVGIRTVSGWRFPAAAASTWAKTQLRFVPTQINQPTLHFRFVSNDGNNNGATYAAVDDLSVRLALEPEWGVTLGPLETRTQ